VKQEPLIPLGCALTTWALLGATRSIRAGTKERTNQMFRRRIYAQGFTIAAMVAGSYYWKEDRQKHTEYGKLLEQKKAAERKDQWIKELEFRDREEKERLEELKRIREAKEGKVKAEAKEGGSWWGSWSGGKKPE
jgi:hypothetical protein